MTASYSGKFLDIVRLLLEYGAEVDMQTRHGGMTALMKASSEGHTAIVRELLDNDADVNLESKTGEDALLVAISRGNLETVCELLRYGAIIDGKHSNQAFNFNNPEI